MGDPGGESLSVPTLTGDLPLPFRRLENPVSTVVDPRLIFLDGDLVGLCISELIYL